MTALSGSRFNRLLLFKFTHKQTMRILAILFFYLSFVGIANAQFKGKVFLDKNKNKLADTSEPGIANVAVSDGQNVLSTDKEGSFNLPGHSKTRFIFITIPAGYKLTDKHYIKVGETTDKVYNFGLVEDPTSAGTSVKMLQITDTETDKYNDWIVNVKNYAKKQGISFIVHTGDIC